MNSFTTYLKPIYLSEEEAMGMLDLCLGSGADMDSAKDRALLKLSDLVRHYLSFRKSRVRNSERIDIPHSEEILESTQILSSLLEFLSDVPETVMQDAIHDADSAAKYPASRRLSGLRYTNSIHSIFD